MLSYPIMFDYFKSERTKLIQAFENLSSEEFTKNRELSFYSIKDTFLHTLSVENNWLHLAYRGLPGLNLKPEDYPNLDRIKEVIRKVDSKTDSLFKELKPEDMKKIVRRKQSDGKEVAYPLELVLYHIPIEVIHHFGEIFAEFWKMNLEAPYLSYLRYTSDKGLTS